MSDKPHLGLGVMINMLGGNEETVEAYHASMGKTIKYIKMGEEPSGRRRGNDLETLYIGFTDFTELRIYDDGQSCCEARTMSCEDKDKFPSFIGATLVSIDVKDGPTIEADYETHEQQFLDITTSKGVFQCVCHNEHNGYYSGFSPTLRTRQLNRLADEEPTNG